MTRAEALRMDRHHSLEFRGQQTCSGFISGMSPSRTRIIATPLNIVIFFRVQLLRKGKIGPAAL